MHYFSDSVVQPVNNHQTQPGGLEWHFTRASFRSCRV